MFDLIIIGGGQSGLTCFIEALKHFENILLIEKENYLGGTLNDCIHQEFFDVITHEKITGPEYIDRLVKKVNKYKEKIKLGTIVNNIEKIDDMFIIETNQGFLDTKKVVIASGNITKNKNNILNYDYYTPKEIQHYLSNDKYSDNHRFVILSSDNESLEIARRLTLENQVVLGVFEQNNSYVGDKKKKIECLDFYDIPLFIDSNISIINNNTIEVNNNNNNRYEFDYIIKNTKYYPNIEFLNNIKIEINDIGYPILNSNMMSNVKGLYFVGDSSYNFNNVELSYSFSKNVFKNDNSFNKKEFQIGFDNSIKSIFPNKILLNEDNKFSEICLIPSKKYESCYVSMIVNNLKIRIARYTCLIDNKIVKINVNFKDVFDLNDNKIVFVINEE